jgi:hypothetical protein
VIADLADEGLDFTTDEVWFETVIMEVSTEDPTEMDRAIEAAVNTGRIVNTGRTRVSTVNGTQIPVFMGTEAWGQVETTPVPDGIRCVRCFQILPAAQFIKDGRTRTGRKLACRPCTFGAKK